MGDGRADLDTDVEVFIRAAERHAEDTSEPGHEAGDLQDCFLAAHSLLTRVQRCEFSSDPDLAATIQFAADGWADEIRDLRNVFRAAFDLLTAEQRVEFLGLAKVRAVLEAADPGGCDEDADTSALYEAVAASFQSAVPEPRSI